MLEQILRKCSQGLYDWNSSNYATRQNRAEKYATRDVIIKLAGDNNNKTSKFVDNNNVQSRITGQELYIKNATSTKVEAIIAINSDYITNSTEPVNKTNYYKISYNVLTGKIDKVDVLDLTTENFAPMQGQNQQ